MACELYEDCSDEDLKANPPSVEHICTMAREIRAARKFRAAIGLATWPNPGGMPRMWADVKRAISDVMDLY